MALRGIPKKGEPTTPERITEGEGRLAACHRGSLATRAA
jgi:hypothetical protein